jgi:hypothetical protein
MAPFRGLPSSHHLWWWLLTSAYLSSYHHSDRKPENYIAAFNFCDNYFNWLSQKLSEKGKVSFEEIKNELMILIKI